MDRGEHLMDFKDQPESIQHTTTAEIKSWSLASDPDSLAVMQSIVASLHKKANAHLNHSSVVRNTNVVRNKKMREARMKA